MEPIGPRGYPVPVVHDAGQGYLVMDRLAGPTMLESALRHPQRIGSYGHLLAQLHIELHRIEAPDWLTTEAAVRGDCLLHRDLHPLNVLMTKEDRWSSTGPTLPKGPRRTMWRTPGCSSLRPTYPAIPWNGRWLPWREGSSSATCWETSMQMQRVPSSRRRWNTGRSIET